MGGRFCATCTVSGYLCYNSSLSCFLYNLSYQNIYVCHIYSLLNNSILAHNEFKFSVHSGTDGLEERNAPLNSKVLG